MKGADIAIAWIDSLGKVTIQVYDISSQLYFYLYTFNFVLGSICNRYIKTND